MPKSTKKIASSEEAAGIEPSVISTPPENFPQSLPRLKLSVRLMHGDEIALGPGKSELLSAIVRTGSISAAGKSMNMSYRRAWMLVEVMNRCIKSPLVETAKGGSHGGGAWLTPLGREVLANYQVIDGATKQVATAYLKLFENMMAEWESIHTDLPS